MLTLCCFSNTAATYAIPIGGYTIGFPHALGWSRGGLIKQTRIFVAYCLARVYVYSAISGFNPISTTLVTQMGA